MINYNQLFANIVSAQFAKTFLKNILRLSKTPSGVSSMVRASVFRLWAQRTTAESAESLVAVEELDMVWLLFLVVVAEEVDMDMV